MKLFRSRRATTALELFQTTEDLVFAVNAQGIVRGSCNPAALNALQRLDSIFPKGGVGVLRRCIQKGTQTINGYLGNEPAVWKTSHVEGTDQVLVVCSTEIGRLEAEATTDGLTGLANKRQFLIDLGRQRSGDSLTALLLIDIDYFKRWNDERGHGFGDTVLSAVGSVVNKNTRPEDRSYRYGGEELAVRMRHLVHDRVFSRAIVLSRAEAIRAGVERLQFEGVDRPVTVSVGIALYGGSDQEKASLHQADRALYYAKHRGRNRVVFSDEVPDDWQQSAVSSIGLPSTSPAS